MKTKKAVAALSALAQDSRLAIFRLLMEGPDEGMAAGDISKALDIPPTTMSFHLSQLKNAGLIDSVKNGRSVIYTAQRKRVKKLSNYLTAKKPSQSEYTL
jgi:DNA-binding transcriptional ArsR family regulator